MKLDQRKISIALVLVYIICSIYAIYALFTLQNDLIYEVQALEVSSLSAAQPVFNGLYLAICLCIIVGLGVFLYMINNKGMEIIYVEKSDDKVDKGNDKDQSDENDKKSFSIASIKDALSNKSKSEEKLLTEGLTEICKSLDAGVGAYYMLMKDGAKKVLQMNATYAMSLAESQRPTFEVGEGLVGQVAAERKSIIIDDIPEGYIKIVSGLGSASPTHVLVSPVVYGKELCGVVEIAAFTAFTENDKKAVEGALEVITEKLYGTGDVKKPAKKDTSKEVKKSDKGNKDA